MAKPNQVTVNTNNNMKPETKELVELAVLNFQTQLRQEYDPSINLHYSVTPPTPPATEDVIKAVFEAVEKATGYTRQQLTGESRVRSLSDARTIAVYLIRCNTTLALKPIGKLFGDRDYTTMIHLLNNYDTWLNHDASFTEMQQKIMAHFTLPQSQPVSNPRNGIRSSTTLAIATAGDDPEMVL